ncbi:MAG: toll/interleukin-1 receptor domain-containing protein [Methylococcales bacterium]
MTNNEWDVFISHASEDKEAVVRPLDKKLRKLGLRTWFDEAEIVFGDSLSRKIDDGLARSTAGIVILSKAFFAKKWPEYELRGLTARVMAGDGRILPVWHGVSHAEVTSFSPTLADAKAGNTDPSLDQLALQIVSSVRPEIGRAVTRKMIHKSEELSATREVREINEIGIGPVRHRTLPARLVNRIVIFSQTLNEVQPHTLPEWLDGFQRDTHPTQEIQIWEDIAARYQRVMLKNELSLDEKHNIFSALLLASLTDAKNSAAVLIDTFGDNAESMLKSTMFDSSDFSTQTDDDLELSKLMPFEIEQYEGPESQIDLTYVEELVRTESGKL